MVVKKYYGKTTRDALRQVRDELGTDALILSNRTIQGGGVEIMAVADGDVNALAASLSTSPGGSAMGARLTRQAPAGKQPSPVASALARTYALPVEPLDEPVARVFHPDEQPEAIRRPDFPRFTPHPSPAYAAPAAPPEPSPPAVVATQPAATAPEMPKDDVESLPELGESPGETATTQKLDQLNDEMRELKSLLQTQMASLAWAQLEDHSPRQAELFRQLLSIGMSPSLCRQLTSRLPAQFDDEAALKWAKSALAHNLRTIKDDDDMVTGGGIFALVGPTGVGKTTTVAKLAARATIRHGAESVALITTDSYRIGAQDQLKLYGRILGVSVYAVDNEADLQLTLADLSHKRLVLIDSVGMGQRDSRVAAQTTMYAAGGMNKGRPIKRILLLAANAAGHTLQDVITRYQGDNLIGCVLSKIDESPTLGVALDVAIRHRLPLFYVTNGQRVPEDLHLADPQYLVERAFQPLKGNAGPFALKQDEFRILQAAQTNWTQG